MNNSTLILMLVMGVFFTHYTSALTAGAAVNASLHHTNNSRQASVGEESDLEQSAGVDITLSHAGKALVVDADYSLVRKMFDKNTQDDRTSATGFGRVKYEQIENVLVWSLENTTIDVLNDRAQVNIQDNSDGRSITTGNGTLSLNPSVGNTIYFQGSYTDVSYRDSDFRDSERAGGSLGWRRSLSPVSSLSLSVSYDDVTLVDSTNDYEYMSSSLGYVVKLSKLSYDLNIGYNLQDRSSGTSEGYLIDARVGYTGAGSAWDLLMLHRLTDTSRANNNLSVSGLTQSGNVATSDVFELSQFEIKYSNSNFCVACDFSASFLLGQERYEIFADDNDDLAAKVNFNYALLRNVNVFSSVEYRDYKFKGENIRVDYDLIRYRAGVSVNVFRDLSLTFDVVQSERSSDDGLTNYDELRGGLSLSYRLK